MDQELNHEQHQLWLSVTQVLVHSEQLFVAFQIKKIHSKLEARPLHPYILSYKQEFFMPYSIKSFRYI